MTGSPDKADRSEEEAVSDPDRTKGLYEKYRIERVVPSEKHAECRYYVLDLSHDAFAPAALRAYAAECRAEYPLLARDLVELSGEAPPDAASEGKPQADKARPRDCPGVEAPFTIKRQHCAGCYRDATVGADKARPWNVARGNAPAPAGDCRKLVWLVDKDWMGWIGIRAYNHAEGAWWINAANGGREESATVTHWMDLPERPL